MRKILILASNPQDTAQLLLNHEIREIDDALEKGKYRDYFSLRPKVAVRISDLTSSLQKEKARIVHFCGHGMGSQGLVLETNFGQQQLLDTQAIADLFRLFACQIECVVLNACYSQIQAIEISKHINYVVGTKRAIRDDAAIAFSKGFYEALVNGENIERAYEFGCNRIQLEIYGENKGERKLVPVYSESENQYIEIPQHEVIELLVKKPLNQFTDNVNLSDENHSKNSQGNYYQQFRTAILERDFNPRSPYKGLKRFNYKDKDLFFGRERLINKLIKAVNQNNLVLVLGASGSGKSSVVRAGVIPQMEDSPTISCYSFLFTPNRNPFINLHRSLVTNVEDIFSNEEVEFVLEGKSDTLSKVAQLFKSKLPQSQCLIFVDQFEEIFTLCSNLEIRRNFIQSLIALAQNRDKSIKLVLAMRSDFFEQFSAYPQFARIAERNIHLVADMEEGELRQAIEKPAAEHGVVFEPGLVAEIIHDVRGQAGSLPLLQYTLDLLWQDDDLSNRTLNNSTYHQLGGVTGALQKHVNEIFQGLPPEQQLATKQIFLRLVDVVSSEQSEVLRTAVSKREFKSEFNQTQSEMIDLLVNKNLLISDDLKQAGQSTVEIAHEALLSSWAELKEWISDAHNTISLNNRLAEDAARWQDLKNEDSKNADDELWSGSKLEKVRELRKEGTFKAVIGGLSELSNEFIDASIDWRDKEQQEKVRLQQRSIKFLIGGLIFASVAAVAAFWQRSIAITQTKMIFVRELAANSELIREQKANLHETSVLLALESYQRSYEIHKPNRPHSEANSALYSGLEQLPNHHLAPISHQDSVSDIAFSADNKYFATGSIDGTAKLIEISSGKETIISHQDSVSEIAFSADNKYFATGSIDRTAKLVELSSGKETIISHQDSVDEIAFSADNKYFATGSRDGTAKLIEISSGKETIISHQDSVDEIAFSADNKYFATGSRDRTAKLIEISS
ncbi:MAG: CHAT domain-containing protein, partial [Cyanobacteria bacterium P01_F01_bin.143]